MTAVAQKSGEPMQDVVKAYLELAFGLTEASKKKAEKTVKKAARELLGKSGATASQLQAMAEELVTTGMQNREAVARIVRLELDRALGRVGLATAEEVATLTARIEDLEGQLREAKATAPSGADGTATASGVSSANGSAASTVPAAQPVAKKAVAKKAVAGKVAPPAVRVPPAAGIAERPVVIERERELPKPSAKVAEPAKAAPKPAPPKKAPAPVAQKVSKAVAAKAVGGKAAGQKTAAGRKAAVDAAVEQPAAKVAPVAFSAAEDVPVAAKKATAKKTAKKTAGRASA
ncbi:hypothetical protein [Catellatospora sp. NPDC049609]|uniref:phasin family protein n=1 Tax=Catellatospora sp. NPDC049609 TaxID=3155505 RepID=UPI00341E09C6